MCLPVVLAVVYTALTSWSWGKETRIARGFFPSSSSSSSFSSFILPTFTLFLFILTYFPFFFLFLSVFLLPILFIFISFCGERACVEGGVGCVKLIHRMGFSPFSPWPGGAFADFAGPIALVLFVHHVRQSPVGGR
ncbi:hypothetical protein LZ31DRAFT_322453 [Colletotrichum somersetense]|nr:hypothetical protein LZ31DRAFT_322453 [Colletotrichum somersetense]